MNVKTSINILFLMFFLFFSKATCGNSCIRKTNVRSSARRSRNYIHGARKTQVSRTQVSRTQVSRTQRHVNDRIYSIMPIRRSPKVYNLNKIWAGK